MRRLPAERLLPGEGDHIELRPVERLGEAGAGGVADGESGAVGAMKPASGTRTPEVVPFQVNTRSASARTRERSGSAPYGASSTSASMPSWSTTSVAQSLPKLSNASSCTGLGPSNDHIAISIAPVSEPGTMPTRKSSGTSSTAGSGRSPPAGAPCRAWSGASGRGPRFWRFSGVHPGRLAHGPDENSGRAGRMAGLAGVVIAMSPILADGLRPVGRAWPAAQRQAFAREGK